MKKIIICRECEEEKEHYGREMCEKCYKKEYYKENREVINKRNRNYREENRELCQEYSRNYCKENPEYNKKYYRNHRYKNGGLSMENNKNCSLFLGVHVAERVLSKVFKNVKQMPMHNPGYDFICNHGKKIDVKSGALRYDNKSLGHWKFTINKNKIADYFLCLAFDNRKDLNPLYIWLIPGKEVNHFTGISISKTTLNKWKKYERELEKVVNCCESMKSRSD